VSLSRELFSIAQRVKLLEEAGDPVDDETIKRYFYGKGALDYRDKLIARMGALPPTYSALEAYYVLLEVFPDPYPGK
jgi:hypothetical protein